ncbi:MAG: hypothetical protein U0821_21635 [Chloroflexota bacterium]
MDFHTWTGTDDEGHLYLITCEALTPSQRNNETRVEISFDASLPANGLVSYNDQYASGLSQEFYWTHLSGRRDWKRAIMILLPSAFDGPNAISLINHEFGHILGLADHADYPCPSTVPSIMYQYCSLSYPTSSDISSAQTILDESDPLMDMAVTSLSYEPDPALLGSTIAIITVIRNNGPESAKDTRVTFTQNQGFAVIGSASITPNRAISCSGLSIGSSGITCDIPGEIAAGSSYTVRIVGSYLTSVHDVAISATVSRYPPSDPIGVDTNLGNNSKNGVIDFSDADLRVTVTDGNDDPVGIGNTVTYAVVVSNLGGVSATAASLAGTLSGSASIVSAGVVQGSPCGWSGSGTIQIQCSLGSIPPGGSASVNITAAAAGGSAVSLTASANSTVLDTNAANNTNIGEQTTVISCSPRPGVVTSVAANQPDGRLLASVSTGLGAKIRGIEFVFSALANATLDIPGAGVTGRTTSFTYVPPVGTQSVGFSIDRVNSSAASTVQMVVRDSCGPWQTFVGGGTAAGF